jgi:sugar phosphate permease
MMLVAYLDRVNITLAGPTLMAALHMSKATFGFVASAFQLGYALLQIPGGMLADRYGAKVILVAALSIWSIFTALTGTATSIRGLIAIRVLFGMGEGIENGAQFKAIADNFEPSERSRASALFLTALALGPALAAPLSTWIIGHYGWRLLFYAFAILGLVVAAFLAAFLPVSAAARVEPETGKAVQPPAGWSDIARQPRSWLTFAAYLLFNIAFWGFITWMPTYLSTTRHIKLAALGEAAAIPYLCGFVGMLLLGSLGTRLPHRRAQIIATSYVLAAVGFGAACAAHSAAASIADLSAVAFCLYGGFGPFWSLALGIVAAGMRGAFSGFVNFGGQIGGFIAPAAVGVLVGVTRSFTAGFVFMMIALVSAALCLVALQKLGPDQPLSAATSRQL